MTITVAALPALREFVTQYRDLFLVATDIEVAKHSLVFGLTSNNRCC
jgi:hypothetical protein